MQTQRYTTTDGSSQRPKAVFSAAQEQLPPELDINGRTADLTDRSTSQETSSSIGSRLRALTSGSGSAAPKPFNIADFRAGADTWQPAITPKPHPATDPPQADISDQAEYDSSAYDVYDSGVGIYEDYSAAPSLAQEHLHGNEKGRSGTPNSAASWVRRGGKVAVATAFLTGVAGAAAAMPSAAADFGQSDVPEEENETSTAMDITPIPNETVVVKTPPTGTTSQSVLPAATAPVPGSKVELHTKAPFAAPAAELANQTVATTKAPVLRRDTQPAPWPALPQKVAPVQSHTKVMAAAPAPQKQIPAPKLESAPKKLQPTNQPTIRPHAAPAPAQRLKPAPQPAEKAPVVVTAPAAEIFAADLQVRISKIVADYAVATSQQALMIARNASADANDKAQATKTDTTQRAEVAATTAIANANSTADTAQAAHYDAETKIRALTIARTALAALTQTASSSTLPVNPTRADLAIADAREAILYSTDAASAASAAALDANQKKQALRKSPTDPALAALAKDAANLAVETVDEARRAELLAEAAVNKARTLTA